jgi:hypothetical protein
MPVGKHKEIIAALGCLVLSAGCGAADSNSVYLGGSAGYSYIGLDGRSILGKRAGFNTNAVGFNATVGGYLSRTIGWELSFFRFGGGHGDPGIAPAPSESLNGVAANMLFHLPVPFIDLFAKAGGAGMFGTIRAPEQGIRAISLDETHFTELAWSTGIGLQHKFHQPQDPGLTARAQYDTLRGHGDSSGMASVGLFYDF